jgi:hypothetical protein
LPQGVLRPQWGTVDDGLGIGCTPPIGEERRAQIWTLPWSRCAACQPARGDRRVANAERNRVAPRRNRQPSAPLTPPSAGAQQQVNDARSQLYCPILNHCIHTRYASVTALARFLHRTAPGPAGEVRERPGSDERQRRRLCGRVREMNEEEDLCE